MLAIPELLVLKDDAIPKLEQGGKDAVTADARTT